MAATAAMWCFSSQPLLLSGGASSAEAAVHRGCLEDVSFLCLGREVDEMELLKLAGRHVELHWLVLYSSNKFLSQHICVELSGTCYQITKAICFP